MTTATQQRIAQGCAGKVAFRSFTRAARAAKRQAENHKGRFGAYACQHCGQFHVGSSVGLWAVDQLRDARRAFAVYARQGTEREQLVGWSKSPNGTDIATLFDKDPAAGWIITRVVERKRLR